MINQWEGEGSLCCLNNISAVLDGGCTVAHSPDCRVGGGEDPGVDVQAGPLHLLPSLGEEQTLVGDVAVVQRHPSPLLPPGTLPPTCRDVVETSIFDKYNNIQPPISTRVCAASRAAILSSFASISASIFSILSTMLPTVFSKEVSEENAEARELATMNIEKMMFVFMVGVWRQLVISCWSWIAWPLSLALIKLSCLFKLNLNVFHKSENKQNEKIAVVLKI